MDNYSEPEKDYKNIFQMSHGSFSTNFQFSYREVSQIVFPINWKNFRASDSCCQRKDKSHGNVRTLTKTKMAPYIYKYLLVIYGNLSTQKAFDLTNLILENNSDTQLENECLRSLEDLEEYVRKAEDVVEQRR